MDKAWVKATALTLVVTLMFVAVMMFYGALGLKLIEFIFEELP